jgi:hypothetical protein
LDQTGSNRSPNIAKLPNASAASAADLDRYKRKVSKGALIIPPNF